jgi:hypothetical protein
MKPGKPPLSGERRDYGYLRKIKQSRMFCSFVFILIRDG